MFRRHKNKKNESKSNIKDRQLVNYTNNALTKRKLSASILNKNFLINAYLKRMISLKG